MRISRVGSKRNEGEKSISLEVKPHGSQASGDEVFTWNGKNFEFKNRRIKNFNGEVHHDYTVAISLDDIHAVLSGIKEEFEIIARSKHRLSLEQKLLDDFESIFLLSLDTVAAYSKAIKAG